MQTERLTITTSKDKHKLDAIKTAVIHKTAEPAVGQLYKFLMNNRLIKKRRATKLDGNVGACFIVEWFCVHDMIISCCLYDIKPVVIRIYIGNHGSYECNDCGVAIEYIKEYCLTEEEYE